MGFVATPARVASALSQRLAAIRPVILGVATDEEPAVPRPGDVLDGLVRAVKAKPSRERVWLLCIAVTGSFPTSDDVLGVVRLMRRASDMDAVLSMLDLAFEPVHAREAHREMQLVVGGTVVDVTFSSQQDELSPSMEGLSRVTRLWCRDYAAIPAVWSDSGQALTATARQFLDPPGRGLGNEEGGHPTDTPLIVPWHSVVVVPRPPPVQASDRTTAIARFSGSAVVTVVADCAPALSADAIGPGQSLGFVKHLATIKHSSAVACLGAMATTELRGFSSALGAQGLSGPELVGIRVPALTRSPQPSFRPRTDDAGLDGPTVLCADAFGLGSDHGALLYAVECLWRQGLRFTLVLTPTGVGEQARVGEVLDRLQRQGDPVRVLDGATGSEYDDLLRHARFVVSLPLHDGLAGGVTAALDHGTPVITRADATTRELARNGGVVLVEPDDDEGLADAMRRMLTDDGELGGLRDAARRSVLTTWDDCARDAWERVVLPWLAPMEYED